DCANPIAPTGNIINAVLSQTVAGSHRHRRSPSIANQIAKPNHGKVNAPASFPNGRKNEPTTNAAPTGRAPAARAPTSLTPSGTTTNGPSKSSFSIVPIPKSGFSGAAQIASHTNAPSPIIFIGRSSDAQPTRHRSSPTHRTTRSATHAQPRIAGPSAN